MKCKTCGTETIGNMNFCHICLGEWKDIRKKIWQYHEKQHGKLTFENLDIRKKDTKRLEKIWRKDRAKFQMIIGELQ